MDDHPAIWVDPYRAVLGIACLLALAWALSENRKAAPLSALTAGLVGQVVIALILLKAAFIRGLFLLLGRGVDALAQATLAGTAFVFGYVGGGPPPFETVHPEFGFGFAFQALPVVILITALSALLYHWRILPLIVQALSKPLRRVFGLSGAVGMCAAAMPFLGMVESPLLIRPYLTRLSRGELFVLMTGGMSTIAGSVMVLYATFLKGLVDDPIGHLLTSALMGIPMAIGIAKTVCPQQRQDCGQDAAVESRYGGAMDAIMQGTMDGVRIAVGIVAVLIVAVALVHLINEALGGLAEGMSLQRAAGLIMTPVAWGLGVADADLFAAGTLLGEKIVLNELIAFTDLAHLPPDTLTGHSRLILVYALCSFSNFGSLAILIGGLSAMAPERRGEIIALGPKAMLAGTMVSCLNGAVAGLILG